MGVHQNLTHAVHPDPVSGAHCWLQKAVRVTRAQPGDQPGDVWVDTRRSIAHYRLWVALTRPAALYSPDGTRRPYWLERPLKPRQEAYRLPEDRFVPRDPYPSLEEAALQISEDFLIGHRPNDPG